MRTIKILAVVCGVFSLTGCVSDFPTASVGTDAGALPVELPAPEIVTSSEQNNGQRPMQNARPDGSNEANQTPGVRPTGSDASMGTPLDDPDAGLLGREPIQPSPDASRPQSEQRPSPSGNVVVAGQLATDEPETAGNASPNMNPEPAGMPGVQPDEGGQPDPVDEPMEDCQNRWPALCQIDCANEPPLHELLHVRQGQDIQLPVDHPNLRCVVVEGVLRINNFRELRSQFVALTAGGRIDGRGSAAQVASQRDGHAGDSLYGRGAGGGGGSGVCDGGDGGPLTDGTDSASAGRSEGQHKKPGGFGGRGGDREGLGGAGGQGGASLKIKAPKCHLAGTIDLSGLSGQTPPGSDGGGGGGGSSGHLELECEALHVAADTFRVSLRGGDGGQGGAVNGNNMNYAGGGGGGGAGGQLKIKVRSVHIGNQIIDDDDDAEEFAQQWTHQQGGRGGPPGRGGDNSEAGRDGETCELEIRVM